MRTLIGILLAIAPVVVVLMLVVIKSGISLDMGNGPMFGQVNIVIPRPFVMLGFLLLWCFWVFIVYLLVIRAKKQNTA